MKNIICMQGPFSKAFNSALIRELDIKYLVTKCTGKNGGFFLSSNPCPSRFRSGLPLAEHGVFEADDFAGEAGGFGG